MFRWEGGERRFAMPYPNGEPGGHYFIWGATAGMLRNLPRFGRRLTCTIVGVRGRLAGGCTGSHPVLLCYRYAKMTLTPKTAPRMTFFSVLLALIIEQVRALSPNNPVFALFQFHAETVAHVSTRASRSTASLPGSRSCCRGC